MTRGRGDYSQRWSSGRGSGSGSGRGSGSGSGRGSGSGAETGGRGGTQHESGGGHGNCSPEYRRHPSHESRPLDTPDSGRGSAGADNFDSLVPVNRERAWIAADGKR